jgi:hypothetical protein
MSRDASSLDTGAAPVVASRIPPVSRAAIAAVGAAIAVLGVALALMFGVAPVHITVRRSEPAQVAGGEFNLTLAPTGQTTVVAMPVTCLPVQGALLPGREPDPACLPKDASHNGVALAGLGLVVAGAIVWQASGVERSLLRDRREGR